MFLQALRPVPGPCPHTGQFLPKLPPRPVKVLAKPGIVDPLQ
jgi:hypothetical protein